MVSVVPRFGVVDWIARVGAVHRKHRLGGIDWQCRVRAVHILRRLLAVGRFGAFFAVTLVSAVTPVPPGGSRGRHQATPRARLNIGFSRRPQDILGTDRKFRPVGRLTPAEGTSADRRDQ